VTVSDRGVVRLNNKPLLLKTLPEKLRSIGATPRTQIMVSVPSGASYRTIVDVTEALASSGYTRVVFTKPKQASSGTR